MTNTWNETNQSKVRTELNQVDRRGGHTRNTKVSKTKNPPLEKKKEKRKKERKTDRKKVSKREIAGTRQSQVRTELNYDNKTKINLWNTNVSKSKEQNKEKQNVVGGGGRKKHTPMNHR